MDIQEPLESGSNSRGTKRRKIQIACTQCRDRKTRCDGVRPVCSTCDRRGKAAACAYEQDEIPTFQHILDVEGRLERLEAQTRRQTPRVGVLACAMENPPLPITTNDMLMSDGVGHLVSPRNFVGSRSSGPLSRDHKLEEDVGATTQLDTPYSQRSTGPSGPTPLCSSNQGFLRNLDSSWPIPFGGDKNTHLPPIPKFLWKRAESSEMIPRRPVADNLLQSFFTFAHEFLPVFHKPAFERRYEALWLSGAPSRPHDPREHLEDGIFLSTINVCFALGSLFSQRIADEYRESTSDEYYQRSRALTNFDICDYSSLSTVSLQLVTGLYLQTTSHTSRCWNVVGMAIRLAQDLGLHKDPCGQAQSDSMEVEMRRRVWHSCVVMDRLLASIYGRPPMISRAWDVQLPSSVNRDYTATDPDGGVSKELIPGASMFCFSAKLMDVLYEILNTVYLDLQPQTIDRSASADAELLAKSLKLNHQLDHCLASMPKRLSSFIASSPSMHCERAHDLSLHEQSLVTRFLYARIMLLRPLTLVIGKRTSRGSLDLESTIIKECCSLCLLSSELLVLSLRKDGINPRSLADWHTVYLMFTAATIFLAVGRYQIVRTDELQGRFLAFKKNCADLLHSIILRNTLVSQLESLIGFLQDVLFRDEQNHAREGPNSTDTSDNLVTHRHAGPVTPAHDDEYIPDLTFSTNGAWDSFDFDQMLEQQFLDPTWLEDVQVAT